MSGEIFTKIMSNVNAADYCGWNTGTVWTTESANSYFDSLSTTHRYHGQSYTSPNYVVYQTGTAYNVYADLPKGAQIVSAYLTIYYNPNGVPTSTQYPYAYDISWGTGWTTSDKRTVTNLASAPNVASWSSSTSISQYIIYSPTDAMRDAVQRQLDYGFSSTSYYLRLIHSDYRTELDIAPTGNNAANSYQTNPTITVSYTMPDILPMEMGVIA